MDEPLLYIIYLRDGSVHLSRRSYSDWREIQDEYEAYMASLGPWSRDEVVGFLREEYHDLYPPAEQQVTEFLARACLSVPLKWKSGM